jgi:hypothetical protein
MSTSYGFMLYRNATPKVAAGVRARVASGLPRATA